MINTLRNISLSILLLGSLSFADITYENASDGDTVGWHIYDAWPSGASVDNVIDAETGNRVIKITGTTSNGVQFLGWNDTNPLVKWKMKADEWNVFYIAVMTSNGSRYLSYTPRDYDVGHDPYNESHKIRLGMGAAMMDGAWHTFTRDIQADITKHEPGNQLEYIQGIKIRGAGSYDNIKTISTLKNIFVIGPSTVSTNGYISNDGTERILEGWGEQLNFYMKNPNKLINQARSGSNSGDEIIIDNGIEKAKGYLEPYTNENYWLYDEAKDKDWVTTLNLIADRDISKKDFLLIQFGGNEKKPTSSTREALKTQFKQNLIKYLDDIEDYNITPVLISSLNARIPRQTRYGYEIWIKEVANENNILFLDLNTKSLNEWSENYTEQDITLEQGIERIFELDEIYGYTDYEVGNWTIHKGINNTHMSPAGARIVAGWVKELACEQSNTSDVAEKLCSQFQ